MFGLEHKRDSTQLEVLNTQIRPQKSLLQCPNYGSEDIKKNGTTCHGSENYKCRGCGRQFVENPKWRRISDQIKAMINRLLLERVPWAGIAQSLELSES